MKAEKNDECYLPLKSDISFPVWSSCLVCNCFGLAELNFPLQQFVCDYDYVQLRFTHVSVILPCGADNTDARSLQAFLQNSVY